MPSRFMPVTLLFNKIFKPTHGHGLTYTVTDVYYWHCPEDLDDSDKRRGHNPHLAAGIVPGTLVGAFPTPLN